MRIRLDIAYDGAGFHGWAAQPGLRTVQGELEAALAAVLREPVVLTVAGRTDAGVHARGQVAHFDVSREAWERLPGRSDRAAHVALLRAVNAVLARQCSAWELGSGNAGDGAASASRAARAFSPRGYSDVIVARVRADAFCHSQVRALMGAFIEVGRGRKPETWPAELLAHPSRSGVTAPIAPGHPLTLEAVYYPDPEEYAVQAARARTYRG